MLELSSSGALVEQYLEGGTGLRLRACIPRQARSADPLSLRPSLLLLHVRIAVGLRRHEALLDGAQRGPAQQVPHRARLVVGAREEPILALTNETPGTAPRSGRRSHGFGDLVIFPSNGSVTRHPPSLHGVPRGGSPASSVLWGCYDALSPSRRASSPSLGGTAGAPDGSLPQGADATTRRAGRSTSVRSREEGNGQPGRRLRRGRQGAGPGASGGPSPWL